MYGDLDDTAIDLLPDGLLSGWATDTGLISFTALVTDELDSTAEKSFSFRINPPVEITTVSVPDGTEGEAYSHQLVSAGGTGVHTWSDKNSELDAWGLSLSTTGLLSGTPTDTGVVSFTASAEDGVGSSDEAVLTFYIEPAYICGDIDNSGGDPNVADLSYLVDYLFKGGPPPDILESANVDGIGGTDINVADLSYFVDYLFKNGPDLVCQ
jgi:hypothetical protein